MKKEVRDKFYNEEINELFSEADHILTQKIRLMDQLSEDIKLLERRLSELTLPVNYHYTTPNGAQLTWDWREKKLLYIHEGESKRLIETPLEIRWHIKDHLAPFVTGFLQEAIDLKS